MKFWEGRFRNTSGRGECAVFLIYAVSNDPGPGVLPLCNFISSGVDKIDFGIAAQYNLILSFIKHRDIPLPWRGVGVLCTRTGWLFPAHGRGGSFCS